jgi:hypothetical protein
LFPEKFNDFNFPNIDKSGNIIKLLNLQMDQPDV